MRLTIAIAAFMLLAAPAAAQQRTIDRIDSVPVSGATTCGFAAYPDLKLHDAAKGPMAATWNSAATENENIRMRLDWKPGDNWRTPPFAGVSFTVPADGTLSQDNVAGASVIIDDGKSAPLLLQASRSKLWFIASLRDVDTIGAGIIGSHAIALQLHDSAGAPLRRFTWDTRRLSEAVETVAVVGWRCATP